jgi:uncharacterized protein YndB with AHSA1/START domain
MNTEPVVTERLFDAPVATVWKALTDKDEMKKWYFDLPEFKPEKGFQFEFMGGRPDGIQYRHLCEITDVVPEKILAYSWRYDGYPGNSIVMFELTEKGTKTLLKLTHTGLETFQQNNPDFDKKNFMEGWNHIVNISLKDFLEGAKA